MSLGSLWALGVIFLHVRWCEAGCAEVDSMTEAVLGEDFMLGCISPGSLSLVHLVHHITGV